MIRLKTLLEQRAAEIGSVPFGDRQVKTPARLSGYLSQLQIPEEPNTPAEDKLIEYLHDYFNDENSVAPDAQIAQLLQKMLGYKSRYPEMLDPSRSKYTGELVYRGTKLPLSFLTGHGFSEDEMFRAQQQTRVKRVLQPFNARTWRKENALKGSFSINPKGKRGFFSFSASSVTAAEFSTLRGGVVRENGELWVPVVLGVSVTSPRLLFNPDFSHSMGAYSGEEECMYIGTTIIANQIEIPPYTREAREKAIG